jgi:DNA helicase-2/ATP-dependent DNA helicase PcrA
MTRAEEKLYLTMAKERLNRGQREYCKPSRFLTELPAENIDKSGLVPIKRETEQWSGSENSRGGLFAPMPKAKPIFKDTDAATAGKSGDIKLGDKVRHASFGDGLVVATSGSGEDLEISVAFPSQGVKKLLWRYAPLTKI